MNEFEREEELLEILESIKNINFRLDNARRGDDDEDNINEDVYELDIQLLESESELLELLLGHPNESLEVVEDDEALTLYLTELMHENNICLKEDYNA